MGGLFIKRSGLQAGKILVCGQREERSNISVQDQGRK